MDPGPELGKEEKGEEVSEEVAKLRRMRERTSWVVWRVWERVGRRERRVSEGCCCGRRGA